MIKKNALEPGVYRNFTKKNQDAKLSRAISFLFFFFWILKIALLLASKWLSITWPSFKHFKYEYYLV